MDHIEIITKFRRFLKRVNYSHKTIINRIFSIKRFTKWLDIPIEEVTSRTISEYIEYLQNRRLKAKTINGYVGGISRFYEYLYHEEKLKILNPVTSLHKQLLPKPLPKFLTEEEVDILFKCIQNKRDKSMFLLMLRCGLRVEEVTNLTLPVIDFNHKRILVLNGKFRKDRIVYMSADTVYALKDYLEIRPRSKVRQVFLVQKGLYRGRPISTRGIQKRIEKYATETGLTVSCHRLRHTMATQLLNADAMLATVQELMGHDCIYSTQRYAKVLNPKVRRDYFKAMEIVMEQGTK
jgi:site-specific recombinase XerD